MEEEFTAAEAAGAMAAVTGFVQAANMRAAALTWMVWGMAFPLAVAAMKLGGDLAVNMDGPLELSFAWGPGMWAPVLVLAWASGLTGFIWHAFAVKPETRLRPAFSLAVTGVLVPVFASALWFAVFLIMVVRPSQAGSLSPEEHLAAVELAFVFAPSPLSIAGVWLLVASLGPWLGQRKDITRWTGAAALVGGLGLGSLRFVGYFPGDAVRVGLVLVAFGAVGVYLYLRG